MEPNEFMQRVDYLAQIALPHVKEIVWNAMRHELSNQALIVADQQSELSVALKQAYLQVLPTAKYIDFESTQPEAILAELRLLQKSDLAILIQSSSFRLSAFRIRIDLFSQGAKVVEHMHLNKMQDEQSVRYIDSLDTQGDYFITTGNRLKDHIESAQSGMLLTSNGCLHMNGPFEPAMRNVGDYSDRKNIGGHFPIGEVFTEAKELESLQGSFTIFAFGDTSFKINEPEQPITLLVENGKVVGTQNSNPTFDGILNTIREHEGVVWIREIGFGLNRAFSKELRVADISAYERMCGIHFSLGSKHPVYSKPQFSKNHTRFHVDVFADTIRFELDNNVIYENGRYFNT